MRHTPHFYLRIHSSDEPEVVGRVRDVSLHGINIKGIQTKVGERLMLVIPGDSFGELGRFVLDARCVWCRKGSRREYISGFEIIGIDAGNKREFQLLIKLSSFKALD